MKQFIIATLIALTLSLPSTLWAETFTSCTKDEKTAHLVVSFKDGTPTETRNVVKVAFAETAHALSAAELPGDAGFNLFVSKLTAAIAETITELFQPKIEDVTCKVITIVR